MEEMETIIVQQQVMHNNYFGTVYEKCNTKKYRDCIFNLKSVHYRVIT